MTRLLQAELRRVASRRLVRITVILVGIAIVLGGALAFVRTDSLSEAKYQQRVKVADAAQRAQNDQVKGCLHAHGVNVGDDYPKAVAQACFPRRLSGAHDPRFHRDRLKAVLQGVAGVSAILAWALGASLVGAEFASRSMTTFLTWETRRTRVILAKAGVAILAVTVFAALAMIAVALAMLPAMLLHGAPLRPGDPSLLTLAGVVGRGALLAAVGGAMGFAIATLGRNTAAALGAGFAYIVVFENILGNSLRDWRQWLLLGNVIVFVSGQNSGNGDVPGRSVAAAGLFLAAVAVTLLVGAVVTFRTRDLA